MIMSLLFLALAITLLALELGYWTWPSAGTNLFGFPPRGWRLGAWRSGWGAAWPMRALRCSRRRLRPQRHEASFLNRSKRSRSPTAFGSTGQLAADHHCLHQYASGSIA